jgi:alpha-galactosidase
MSKMEDVLALLITGFALSAWLPAAPAGRGSAPVTNPPPLLTKIASAEGFSFKYGGKPSKEFLPAWKRGTTSRRLPDGRTLETITYQDPASGLEVSRELTRFPSFPALEVLLRVRNAGKADTPVLESILPLDFEFDPPGAQDAVLHHVLGSASRTVQDGEGGMSRDFSPVDKPLSQGAVINLVHYVMNGDQHVESYLPFFNLQWQGGGMIGGIGWTGQWRIQAKRGASRTVGLQVGQETTHFILHPGESVRTPRVLLLQWAGQDRLKGHNLWRRLLVSYYVPRIDGQVPLPPIAYTCSYLLQFEDIAKKTGRNPLQVMPTLKQTDLGTRFIDQTPALNWVTEENQLDLLRRLPSIGLDTYWIDAGWFEGLWPNGRGSWVPKKEFPRGLKPIGDAAHARGLKFLLWFDPEGVGPGSLIEKEHPAWVLHHPNEGEWGGIFKWSDPAATRYMTDLIAGCIRNWGVDIYRNDRNTIPVPFWKQADAPDRQGITEIRQIEGLYAFFDGLLDRFPKLTIDNANWRGTGPDLEMMQRSLGSLTRSELTCGGLPHPIADQAQTLELSLWIPLDSNLLHAVDPYNFRSMMTTGIGIGMNLLSPYVPVDELRKGIAELKSVRPYWLGDYYPLTPANLDDSSWAGWQFNRSEMGGGFAVLFRRPKSEQAAYAARLRGLDAKASYQVTFAETFEVKAKRVMTGAELSTLRVEVASAPGSVMIRYRKALQ